MMQIVNLTNEILDIAAKNLISDIRRREAENPILFAKKIGFEPDNWQRNVLMSKSKKLILNCSRQSGKSSTTSVLASHRAIHKPGSLILIVCPSERQSGELLRKIKNILLKTPDVDFDRNSTLQIEMSNGSRILALPSNEGNIRTFSAVDLLILDEASRIDDEVYHAVKPMLAVSGGQQILLSTPFAQFGFFYDVWTNGENWERFTITAENCPRITSEFLVSEKKSMPEFLYLREYFCQFTDSDLQIFPSDLVQAAIDNSLQSIAW